MKKNLLVVALLAVVGMSAAVIVWQRGELNRLREIIAGRPVEFAPAPAHPVVTATPAVEDMPAAPLVVEPATAAPKPPVAAPGRPANFMSQIGKMAKDPAFKDMIRSQQKMMLDMTYGALFKSLNLSAEDAETLKQLLVDRQMAVVDDSMAMMSGEIPAAERTEKVKQIAETMKDGNKKIEDFLGAESYAVFKEYEDTQSERMQVNLFKQSLTGEDALTDEQEQQLIAAMYQERKNLPNPDFVKNANTDPTKFTGDGIAAMQKQLDQLQDKYLQTAGNILSAPQLEQFKKSLEQQRAMQAMGLKMAAQMFGEQKPAAK